MNNVNPFSEFTVVVPIFNKKDYIKRCLFSISKASNGEYLEVILVDDGSTDNWEEVLKENSFLNLEIKVIKQSNQGVSSARNTGLKNCSTKYCCFLDADDEWNDNYLTVISGLVKSYPKNAFYCTGYAFVDANNNVCNFINKKFSSYVGEVDSYIESSTSGHTIIQSNLTVNTSFLLSHGGFPVGVSHGEDRITWFQLTLKNKIIFDSRICFYRHESQNNSSSTWNPNNGSVFLGEITLKKYDHLRGIKKLRIQELSRYGRHAALRNYFLPSMRAVVKLIAYRDFRSSLLIVACMVINLKIYNKLKAGIL